MTTTGALTASTILLNHHGHQFKVLLLRRFSESDSDDFYYDSDEESKEGEANKSRLWKTLQLAAARLPSLSRLDIYPGVLDLLFPPSVTRVAEMERPWVDVQYTADALFRGVASRTKQLQVVDASSIRIFDTLLMVDDLPLPQFPNLRKFVFVSEGSRINLSDTFWSTLGQHCPQYATSR